MSISALQKLKVHVSLAPIDANGAAATCTGVNTAGFSSAMCIFTCGVIGAAAMDALGILEADADTGYATITGAQWLTTDLPGNASDGLVYVCYLDLRKRKKWLNFSVDAGAVSSLCSAHIILSGADESPNTDAERGITGSSKFVT